MDTPANQRIWTDSELLEDLCQIVQDVMGYANEENSWYYCIGCVDGNMSAQVFPAMASEYQQWEAENRQWQEQYEQEMTKICRTESFQAVAIKEV
jgi:transaldolase